MTSIKQINAHTNIEIASDRNGQFFEVEKRGKKVTAITLYFGEKTQRQLDL